MFWFSIFNHKEKAEIVLQFIKLLWHFAHFVCGNVLFLTHVDGLARLMGYGSNPGKTNDGMHKAILHFN